MLQTVLSVVTFLATLETCDIGPGTSSESSVGIVRFTLDKRCFVIIKLSATEMALLLVEQARDSKLEGKFIWFDSTSANQHFSHTF